MPRTVLRFSAPAAGAVLNSLRLVVPGAGAVLNGPWREVTWPVAVLNSPWLPAPGAPKLLAGSQLQVIRAVEHFFGGRVLARVADAHQQWVVIMDM